MNDCVRRTVLTVIILAANCGIPAASTEDMQDLAIIAVGIAGETAIVSNY